MLPRITDDDPVFMMETSTSLQSTVVLTSGEKLFERSGSNSNAEMKVLVEIIELQIAVGGTSYATVKVRDPFTSSPNPEHKTLTPT